jgi:hypothetical protein
MGPTTLKQVEWIHDCVVHKIVYDASRTVRSLSISMDCPGDLGYEPWAGRRIVLTAIEVAAIRHSVWATANSETIDTIRPGITTDFQKSTAGFRRLGVRFPDLEFTASFHSGSALEVICESLQVAIES